MPSLRRTIKSLTGILRFPILLSFSETTAPGSVLIRQATAGASKGILASRQLQGFLQNHVACLFCCRCRHIKTLLPQVANNETYISLRCACVQFLSKSSGPVGPRSQSKPVFPTHGKCHPGIPSFYVRYRHRRSATALFHC